MKETAGGVFIGSTMTFIGFIWFWGILYNWLWLGIVHSSSTGWIVGYLVLFIIFALLSIPIVILLGIGYWLSVMLIID